MWTGDEDVTNAKDIANCIHPDNYPPIKVQSRQAPDQKSEKEQKGEFHREYDIPGQRQVRVGDLLINK